MVTISSRPRADPELQYIYAFTGLPRAADPGARSGGTSPESAVDVVEGAGVLRRVEHGIGRTVLDYAPGRPLLSQEERRVVGDPLGLLHVVGHDHDGDLGPELLDGAF